MNCLSGTVSITVCQPYSPTDLLAFFLSSARINPYPHNKVKQLKETADSKEMIGASRALYDYVLPVYKTEYMELARLYDEGAAKESIASYAQSIQDKYYPGFAERFDKVTAAGKLYAKEHNINVQWDVQTSPQFK